MSNHEETHRNESWGSHFKSYNGVQCSNEEVFLEDSFKWMSGVKSISCGLRDQNRTQLEKFKIIDELINYKLLSDYFPDVAFFLKNMTEPLSTEEQAIFNKLKNNEQMKTDFIAVLYKLPLSEFLEDALSVSMKLDWINSVQLEAEMKRAVIGVLSQDLFTAQTKDYICLKKNESYLNDLRAKAQSLESSQVNTNIFNSKYGLEILKCLGVNSELLYENIRKITLNSNDETTKVSGLQILKQNLKDEKNLEAFVDHSINFIKKPHTDYWITNTLFEDVFNRSGNLFGYYYHGEYFAEPSEKTIKQLNQILKSKQANEDRLGQFQELFLLSVMGRNPNPSPEQKKIYWKYFDKVSDQYIVGVIYHLNPKFYENDPSRVKHLKDQLKHLGDYLPPFNEDIAMRYLKMVKKHPSLFSNDPFQKFNDTTQMNPPFTNSWFEHASIMYYLEDSHENGVKALKSSIIDVEKQYETKPGLRIKADNILHQYMIRERDGDIEFLINMLSGSHFWRDMYFTWTFNTEFSSLAARSLSQTKHPDQRFQSVMDLNPLSAQTLMVLSQEPSYWNDLLLEKSIDRFIQIHQYDLSRSDLQGKTQQYIFDHFSKEKIREITLSWALKNKDKLSHSPTTKANMRSYLGFSKEHPISKVTFDQMDVVFKNLDQKEINYSNTVSKHLLELVSEYSYLDASTTQEIVRRFVNKQQDYSHRILQSVLTLKRFNFETTHISKNQINKMMSSCKDSEYTKQYSTLCEHVRALSTDSQENKQ
ncbi:MAG: hypothetical protein KA715_14180 [Xanthomonadaceae bacterium]|nr:hypothetical protein [Xanthomonadaceae bacterium]